MSGNRAMIYVVRSGDTLEKISRLGPGYPKILEANPHLKKPRLTPGDLVFLPTSPGFTPNVIWKQNLEEANAVWRSTGASTRKFLMEHFDMIDRLTDVAHSVNYSFRQSASWTSRLRKYVPTVTEMTHALTSVVSDDLLAFRRETISLLKRCRFASTRLPVLLIDVKISGLYCLGKKLRRMVRMAEKIRVGSKLIWLDVGVQAGKAAIVASTRGTGREMIMQNAGGKYGNTAGRVMLGGAGVLCASTVDFGAIGSVACGGAVALAGEGAEKTLEQGRGKGQRFYQGGSRVMPPLP